MIGDALRRALGGKYRRVLVEEDVESAAAYLPEKDIIICVARGRRAYYAKIARLSETGGCEAAYYHPAGLYVLAETLDKLIEKLVAKIEKTAARPQG